MTFQITPRHRWVGHCIAAAKQSGLNFLPALEMPCSLTSYLGMERDSLRLLGDRGSGSLAVPQALSGRRQGQSIVLLVGPEGGLTDAERTAVLDAGFVGTRLGHTTLRIETAAIALLAAVTAGCES